MSDVAFSKVILTSSAWETSLAICVVFKSFSIFTANYISHTLNLWKTK